MKRTRLVAKYIAPGQVDSFIKEAKLAGKKMSNLSPERERSMAMEIFLKFHQYANEDLDIADLQRQRNNYFEYITKFTVENSIIPPVAFQVKGGAVHYYTDLTGLEIKREIISTEITVLINSLFSYEFLAAATRHELIKPVGFSFMAAEDEVFDCWHLIMPRLMKNLSWAKLLINARNAIMGDGVTGNRHRQKHRRPPKDVKIRVPRPKVIGNYR